MTKAACEKVAAGFSRKSAPLISARSVPHAGDRSRRPWMRGLERLRRGRISAIRLAAVLVAGGESGGGPEGLAGWLMAQQSWLTHLIAARVHALHGQPSAALGLVGLGLAYGVVHAAGPGHGKAVLASTCWPTLAQARRLMALMAALLQAVIAIALVGAAGFVFTATASEMNHAADLDRPRELLQHRRRWRVAGLAQGRSADSGVRPACRSPPRGGCRPGLRGRCVGAARVQSLGRGLSRGSARRGGRAGRGDRCVWSCPCFRPCSARRIIFLARRGWNGDRRGRAALLGRDFGAGVRHDAGIVRGWSRGRVRHGDRHGGHDWGARLDRRLRRSRRRCVLRLGKLRALRWWRRDSNSPPRSRCWRSASRFWSGREAEPSRPASGWIEAGARANLVVP